MATVLDDLSIATSSPTLWDPFQVMRAANADRMLAGVHLATCPLDPCPPWLVKLGWGGVIGWVQGVVNASLHERAMSVALKQAVV